MGELETGLKIEPKPLKQKKNPLAFNKTRFSKTRDLFQIPPEKTIKDSIKWGGKNFSILIKAF